MRAKSFSIAIGLEKITQTELPKVSSICMLFRSMEKCMFQKKCLEKQRAGKSEQWGKETIFLLLSFLYYLAMSYVQELL